MAHLIGARNNPPDLTINSSLRPPSTRNPSGASGHHLRASADLGTFGSSTSSTSPMAPRGMRPLSEVFLNHPPIISPSGSSSNNHAEDAADQAAQQWIADIDQYETTLEEMAAATLDQDFKDELKAIEQWFRVLTEPERTASLYALLQQTTQVQIRFFGQVLQQMAKNLPMSGVLSPANFTEKDAMSSRMNDAMTKLTVDTNRPTSLAAFNSKPPASPGMKRNSGLDPDTINSMFPDAAAAIAKQKADFKEHTGTMPSTANRNGAVGDRSPASYLNPGISQMPNQEGLVRSDSTTQLPPSPWNPRGLENLAPITRPKSSTSQRSQMGQFQALPSAGLLSPRSRMPGDTPLHKSSMDSTGLPMLSPYTSVGNWASMANTPLNPNFSTQGSSSPVDMVANATAMKLAALSTVNNRIQLDDARKYRRARSSGGPSPSTQNSVGLPNTNFTMTNELGQILTPQQSALLHAQHLVNSMQRHGSRPNSPGLPMTPGSAGFGAGLPHSVSSPNGFLAAYDHTLLSNGMASMSMNHLGLGAEGYVSDNSEANRGRSPRGRRGPTKASEDPTALALLQDVPDWLRTLRLHKYTDNLKEMPWQQIVALDDKGLVEKGVTALGARRKLLKVFEQVREVHGLSSPSGPSQEPEP